MEQWGHFLFDVISWSLALLATFEGARRIAVGRRTRASLLLVAIGSSWCILYGGIALYVARSSEKALEMARNSGINELPRDWGSQLPAATRERDSLTHAAIGYRSTGPLLEYFNQSGERVRFSPTQKQLSEREATVEAHQQL